MIIFGTQGSTRTVETGTFFCPECQRETSYRRRRVRQMASVFFVPVVSLGERGQYIECRSCGGTFREEVLDYQPEPTAQEIEAVFKTVVRQIMILMMTSDREIQDEEIATIQAAYRQIAETDLSEAAIRREAQEVRSRGGELLAYLRDVGTYLNEPGKEMVVQAAFFVAAADGTFHEQEQHLLAEIGKALEMTRAHLDGVVREMTRPE